MPPIEKADVHTPVWVSEPPGEWGVGSVVGSRLGEGLQRQRLWWFEGVFLVVCLGVLFIPLLFSYFIDQFFKYIRYMLRTFNCTHNINVHIPSCTLSCMYYHESTPAYL